VTGEPEGKPMKVGVAVVVEWVSSLEAAGVPVGPINTTVPAQFQHSYPRQDTVRANCCQMSWTVCRTIYESYNRSDRQIALAARLVP